VDAETEGCILDLLLAKRKAGLAMLIVTHSHGLAARADRLLTLQDGRLTHD
jgi:predicted ABC-type transport system involved in lysophospholipase L1 biosynthesis ATPase subunit